MFTGKQGIQRVAPIPIDYLETVFERLENVQPEWEVGEWGDCSCSIFDSFSDSPSWGLLAQEQAALLVDPNRFRLVTAKPPALQRTMGNENGTSLGFEAPDDPKAFLLQNIGELHMQC